MKGSVNMLDLDKLEKQLDEALAKETKESMLEWLKNKRTSNVNTYLGEGEFRTLESKSLVGCLENSYERNYSFHGADCGLAGESNYRLAS